MSSAPFEIIAGPASVWAAPVGTVMPLPDVNPPVPWASLGRTDGGVKVAHNQTTKNLMVDQSILPQKVIRTEDSIEVTMSLAELTLDKFSLVLDNVALTTTAPTNVNAGYISMPLSSGVDIPQFAMLVRGPSPYMNGNMQYELSRVLQSGKPDVTYKRDAAAVLATTWMALEDQNVPYQFGYLRAMNAAAT